MRVEIILVFTIVSSREVGCRGAPQVRIDGPLVEFNVGRGKEIFSLPEPNPDAIFLAAGESVKSAAEGVEILTVRRCRGDLSTTTLVVVELSVTVRREG